MAKRLLFDTDVLVEYLRGRKRAVEYLEGLEPELCTSAITVAELYAGVRNEEEERSLGQFLLAFTVLPITREVARLGGLYRRDYKPGHGTGLADALIAATARESGAELVTFNKRHFPMLSNIAVPYER